MTTTRIDRERVIAEQGTAGEWLVMYPDGHVAEYQTHEAAERAIRKRARRIVSKSGGIAVTEIEWRTR
jgi:hypothetical protein